MTLATFSVSIPLWSLVSFVAHLRLPCILWQDGFSIQSRTLLFIDSCSTFIRVITTNKTMTSAIMKINVNPIMIIWVHRINFSKELHTLSSNFYYCSHERGFSNLSSVHIMQKELHTSEIYCHLCMCVRKSLNGDGNKYFWSNYMALHLRY